MNFFIPCPVITPSLVITDDDDADDDADDDDGSDDDDDAADDDDGSDDAADDDDADDATGCVKLGVMKDKRVFFAEVGVTRSWICRSFT